jgi:hypothetical protein
VIPQAVYVLSTLSTFRAAMAVLGAQAVAA